MSEALQAIWRGESLRVNWKGDVDVICNLCGNRKEKTDKFIVLGRDCVYICHACDRAIDAYVDDLFRDCKSTENHGSIRTICDNTAIRYAKEDKDFSLPLYRQFRMCVMSLSLWRDMDTKL